MIVVLKILSGEEIIGNLACETDEEFVKLDQYELIDPMWIVPSENGAMKLRDACMLSANDGLLFVPECIITCYKPSESLIGYYLRVSEYTKNVTRESINSQIELATMELGQQMKEEKEYISKMSEALRKITGSKLH